jgi:hypothetical protein
MLILPERKFQFFTELLHKHLDQHGYRGQYPGSGVNH